MNHNIGKCDPGYRTSLWWLVSFLAHPFAGEGLHQPCTTHRPNPCNNTSTIVVPWSQFNPLPSVWYELWQAEWAKRT